MTQLQFLVSEPEIVSLICTKKHVQLVFTSEQLQQIKWKQINLLPVEKRVTYKELILPREYHTVVKMNSADLHVSIDKSVTHMVSKTRASKGH